MFDSMLTEADRQYLRRVEEFCREKVDPHCAKWDDEENLPRDIFTDAGRLGLLGMTAPAELGGRGMSFVAYARVLMTLGRHSAALAMDIAAHNALSLGHVLTFGSEARNVPSMVTGTLKIGTVDIGGQRLVALAASVAILTGLWLFMQHTRLGAAILAISQDAEAARYMGIPSDRIYSIVMGLSAGIAAAAGVLVAPFQSVIPSMGLLPLVKAFAIVIVGGLGSIPGSIVGALLLGYVETFIAFEVSIEWSQIVSVLAVLLTLVIRPAGFFGKRPAF